MSSLVILNYLQRNALRTAAIAAMLGALLTVAFLCSRDMSPLYLKVAAVAVLLSVVSLMCRVFLMHRAARCRTSGRVS